MAEQEKVDSRSNPEINPLNKKPERRAPRAREKIALKPQVSEMIDYAASVKVKYKETSRGGLAVNVIEC